MKKVCQCFTKFLSWLVPATLFLIGLSNMIHDIASAF
jgi:hypothetical protein